MSDKRDIAVIGLGTFGAAIAKELHRMGDHVVGIDIDSDIVSAMSDHLDIAIQTNATDLKNLEQAGIESCNAIIIAIGDNMQDSLLTAMQVRKLGCKTLYIKAQTPEHGQILKAMGFDNLIEPEQNFALHLAQRLHNPRLVDFLNLGNGNYIASLLAPSGSNCKTLQDIDFAKYDLTCVAIDIGERLITQDLDSHSLGIDDKLILAGKRQDLRRFAPKG